MEPCFTIALFEPKIPQNTGNIARLCLATNCQLELVGRLGFVLDNRRLKRAGLDYWPKITPKIFPDLPAYITSLNNQRYHVFSTHGTQPHYACPFNLGDKLIFGSEDAGFPPDFLAANVKNRYRIPMFNNQVRSLNLSSSVAVVLYEAIRQNQQKLFA